MYLELKKLGWPKDRFRLLCTNCNQARAYFGVCPHERGRGKPPVVLDEELQYNAT